MTASAMTDTSNPILETLCEEIFSLFFSACRGRPTKNDFNASKFVPCHTCRFPNAWFGRSQISIPIGQILDGRLLPTKRISDRSEGDLCPGCEIADACFESLKAEQGIGSKDGQLMLSFYAPTGQFRVHVYSSWSQRTEFERVLDVFTLPFQPKFQPLKIASVPSSDLRWTRINSWLRHCNSHHKQCSKQDKFAPSRLLYLDGSDPAYIKLVDHKDRELAIARKMDSNIKYACLSYVWGQTRSRYQTTQQQIAANKRSIPLKDLESTFRDAVECARRLGISFLWIDSFCIVQGDVDDWRYESGQMAKVYKNAFVTIGAGMSRDSSEGFLAQCSSNEQTQLVQRKIKFLDKTYEVHVRKNQGHWHWEEEGTLPLTTRAWTLQEQLLSRRFLLFTHGEVVLECREGVTCECSLAETPFAKDSVEIGSFKSRPSRAGFHQLSNMVNPHQQAQQWWKIVRMYMSRGLTKPQDKLPALSALASEFQGRLSDEYLAGHWKSTLASTLTWSISHETKKLPTSRSRLAPSWSWISAPDGPVDISEIPRTPLFDVVSTQMAIDPLNPTGEVQKGILIVRSHLIPIASMRRHRVLRGEPRQLSSSDGPGAVPNEKLGGKILNDNFAPDIIFHGLQPSRAQLLPDYDFNADDGYDKIDDPKMVFMLCHTEVDGACWAGLLLREIKTGSEETTEKEWREKGPDQMDLKTGERSRQLRKVAVYERLGKMTVVLRPGEKCVHPKELVCIM